MKPLTSSKEEENLYENIITYEENLLKDSGLIPWKDFWIFNAPINYKSEAHYIHTIKCGIKGDNLLMIHGYGGSGVTFFKMLKRLSEKYIVYCIDLLGMGLSSRTEFLANSAEETVDYFLTSIEEWRKYIGIEQFHIAGHSLGGYLTAQYSLRYQNNVKKVILLSPAGITSRTESENEKYEETTYKYLSLRTKLYYKLIDFTAKKKTTPHSIIRKTRLLGRLFFRKLINSHAHKMNPESLRHFKNYFLELVKLPPGSESAVHHLFEMPLAQGKLPVEEELFEKLNKQVLIVFGDNDAMETTGARRLYKKDSNRFTLKAVKDSGHQVLIDNPEDTTTLMLEFLEKE